MKTIQRFGLLFVLLFFPFVVLYDYFVICPTCHIKPSLRNSAATAWGVWKEQFA